MKIATKNVYYMLSYAFRALNQKEYGKVKTETFENIADLFAEILSIGINKQIKQGLIKDYIDWFLSKILRTYCRNRQNEDYQL